MATYNGVVVTIMVLTSKVESTMKDATIILKTTLMQLGPNIPKANNDGVNKKNMPQFNGYWSLFVPGPTIFHPNLDNLAKFVESLSWLTIGKVIIVISFESLLCVPII